ncbi:MAG: BTAD domain-containing putative transcriptional regulator [Chloroflexota bacterium]
MTGENKTSSLQCQLFGSLALFWGDKPVVLPRSETIRSLLAYLLLHGRQACQRVMLAGVFWPDMDEASALRQLSQALWRIRKTLPDVVRTTPGEVSLSPSYSVFIDVEAFGALLENAPPGAGEQASQRQIGLDRTVEDEAMRLRQAVTLYQGDLLEGMYDDWVLNEREYLREQFLQALNRLLQLEKGAGRLEEALRYALRLAQAEPWQEQVQREVMRLYVALQRPEAALKQYEACRTALRNELDIEPEPETVALAQEITVRHSTEVQAAQAAYLPHPELVQKAPLVSDQVVQLPLIGRQAERGALTAQVEVIFRGASGLALVEGEAGVGKTRLMQEIARDAEWRGAQVLWGRFLEGGAGAFEPVVRALQSGLSPLRISQLANLLDPVWLGVLSPFFSELGEQLALKTAELSDPARERERLGQAFGQLLHAWGQITPLVLILEDLHWADQDSLGLLSMAFGAIHLTPVFLLCTQRGEEARANSNLWAEIEKLLRHSTHSSLQLKRLDDQACSELVRLWLGLRNPAPRFEARLYQETGGNPLFVLESLRTLYAEGLLSQDEHGGWQTPWDKSTLDYGEMPLSPVIETVIARRLGGLDVEERSVLNRAAAIGEEFDFPFLYAVSGLQTQALLRSLNGLLRKQFLVEMPSAYRFSHDKVRQVVYQSIGQDEGIALQRSCGAALEKLHPERVARLARHFYRGQVWDKAVRYSQEAGNQAARVHAQGEAKTHYTNALRALRQMEAVPDSEVLFELHLGRERACAMLGERELQFEDLTALSELLDDQRVSASDKRLQVSELWATYWDTTSNFPKALASVQTFAELAQELKDERAGQRAYLMWGRMLRVQGQIEAAQAHIQQAYLLAQRTGDLPAQANCLCNLGVIGSENGNYGQAGVFYQQALEAAQQGGDPEILAYVYGRLAGLAHYLADFKGAIEYYHKALAIWRAFGNRRKECMDLYNLSTALSNSSDYSGARRTLEQVCELAHAIGDRRVEGYGWVFLGLVLEYLGDYEAGRLAYEEGLRLRREVGLRALEIDALSGLARTATALGNHQQAVGYANQVLEWLEIEGYEGVGDALLAYCGAYRALFAAGEEARGRTALQNAYSLLMQFADSIPDPEQQRAYLHDSNSKFDVWGDYQRWYSRRVTVSLPHSAAPTGRPLRPEEWVAVTWTLEMPEDQQIQDKARRRQARLLRLIAEAEAQDAVPTLDDLAQALDASLATVKRDLASLRKAGHVVKTRGKTRK